MEINIQQTIKKHIKIMECYIEFLDAENNFKPTKKEFETYDQAKQWMLENFEKFNSDMINYN